MKESSAPAHLSGLGRNFSCRGLAVSLFRELLAPRGELLWLQRDTGYRSPCYGNMGVVPRSRPL